MRSPMPVSPWSLLLVGTLVSSVNLARAEIVERDLLFGFEPTATNKRLDDASESRWVGAYEDRKRSELVKALVQSLRGAKDEGWGVLSLPKGKAWDIGSDPGVIEVRPPPMHLGEVKSVLGPLYRAFRQ